MSTWSDYLRSRDRVFEKDCAVCGAWPRAERARRRSEGDYIRLPIKGTCGRCWAAFWKDICVVTDSEEEYEALKQAIREGRRRENPMPNGHELLKEIRARKPPTEH